jgi:glycosyltransferase involved in cell wall biosynthesis
MINHLLVSTENPDYRVTGGLGTYVKEVLDLNLKSGMLLVDLLGEYNSEIISREGWFDLKSILGLEDLNKLIRADHGRFELAIAKALEILLKNNPSIKSIEFFEPGAYHAIIYKILGKIDRQIKIITTCHGSSLHLAKAESRFIHAEHVSIAYREKFVLENSDIVNYPTEFLRESYRSYGIDVDATRNNLKRLPINTEKLLGGSELIAYEKLVYIGKANKIKGFDLFLESILRLVGITSIRYVIECYVTDVEVRDEYIRRLLSDVALRCDISLVSFSRHDFLSKLKINSSKSLAIISYTGDNHPNVVLELMAAGHDFIAVNKGGTPELIPNKYKDDYICCAEPNAVAEKIIKCFYDVKARSEKIKILSSDYLDEQAAINLTYKEQDSNYGFEIGGNGDIDLSILSNMDIGPIKEKIEFYIKNKILLKKFVVVMTEKPASYIEGYSGAFSVINSKYILIIPENIRCRLPVDVKNELSILMYISQLKSRPVLVNISSLDDIEIKSFFESDMVFDVTMRVNNDLLNNVQNLLIENIFDKYMNHVALYEHYCKPELVVHLDKDILIYLQIKSKVTKFFPGFLKNNIYILLVKFIAVMKYIKRVLRSWKLM